MTKTEKYEAALAVKFSSDAGKNLTVRGYLRRLLQELWREGEGFSGKRPFGNSGWERDLYRPLVKAGLIAGTFDTEYGDTEIDDYGAAEKFVEGLISHALRDP